MTEPDSPYAKATYESFLDRHPTEARARITRLGAGTLLDVYVHDPTPDELMRIAQHILQLAGHSPIEVATTLKGLRQP